MSFRSSIHSPVVPLSTLRPAGCPTDRITRGQGDWLSLTLCDSLIRYLSPAYADAPYPRLFFNLG
jgi:hypothetical protein